MMLKVPNIVIWKAMRDALGRQYDKEEVLSHILKMYKGQILGQLGRTEDMKVSLEKVSHYFENVRIEEENLLGDLVVMETPCGRILQGLLEGGVKLRTSTSSTGYVDNMNVSQVRMISIDIVQHGLEADVLYGEPNVFLSS